MREGRFADIEYMCDEKRFPVRVLILADIVRARMHYNWTTTNCRLEYIQPEAHASPDDIVMRDDKGLQFIVLRSLDGRRPFAAPCADLARSLDKRRCGPPPEKKEKEKTMKSKGEGKTKAG